MKYLSMYFDRKTSCDISFVQFDFVFHFILLAPKSTKVL